MARSKLTFALASVALLSIAYALPDNSRAGQMNAGQSASQTSPDFSRMEQIVQDSVSRKEFMGAVLVARGDEIILDKGYGFANLEWNIPNNPSTKFRLGSVTKQFTAACTLLLEERGKLSVDDPVKKYISDAPAAWDKITIRNLLTHTSGIPNYTSFPDFESFQATHVTPEQLVAHFRDKPLDFQPGEKWSYSNSGYALLGYLIEKVSGETYDKFLQENIFTPLGMEDSGYDSNSAIILNRASGYTPGPTGIVNASYVDMTTPLSAGALYSTTGDLHRWLQGLFGGRLLKPESLEKMTTPFKDDYAFGLSVLTVNGRQLIAHNGGINGFNTIVVYYPEEHLEIIVLSNINGAAPQNLSAKLASVVHGEKVVLLSERKEITVDAKLFDGYTGRYQLTPSVVVTISREDNHLFAQLAGQPKFEAFPESAREYFLKAVDAQITFVADTTGRVTEVVLHQNGADRHAKRIE